MLKLLAAVFGKKAGKASPGNVAADHWSRWQQQVDADKPKWVDWGEHPIFLGLIYRELFGAADTTLFHFLQQQYPHYKNCTALSLCSGDGAFENLLLANGVFGSITGIDASEYRVKKAVAEHCAAGKQLDFRVGDVNQGNYGESLYEVVFAKAALHHIENLEAALKGIKNCLQHKGHLVTIDFFGPSRFQWTEAQLKLANEFLQAIPESLRTDSKGVVKARVTRPTVAEMIAADPSEAARSAELYAAINANFNILEEFNIGGTVFNLVFTADILSNFDPANQAHKRLIGELFERERALINAGQLPSDFKFIIAEKSG